MKTAVIVIPTFNERRNIGYLISRIISQRPQVLHYHIHILVVDDSSPDGTADVVRDYAQKHPYIHLLINQEKKGLGAAYKVGFQYALHTLNADVVFEMDGDLSHNPSRIPAFLQEIDNGFDLVIGSRYVAGGTLPPNWHWFRRLNSICGNVFARLVGGLHFVHDCTSGYRAISAQLLRRVNLDQLGTKGYAFQISLLYSIYRQHGLIQEIPIHFTDRRHGHSKLRVHDISEFILFCLRLRIQKLPLAPLVISLLTIFVLTLLWLVGTHQFALYALLLLSSVTLTVQGILTLTWMLHAWNDPYKNAQDKKFQQQITEQKTFSVLIPARQEAAVIGHTLESFSRITYPDSHIEVIVLCRNDDTETIQAVNKALQTIHKNNLRLITFSGGPITKPYALNIGLSYARHDIIAVFDAEDEPHPDVFKMANTNLVRTDADVLQAGIQLMNYRSRWFSPLNVLEYYFWFKSALHFFAQSGLTPLGGNTIFFKKEWLKKVNGWDEYNLTEDADIGIRLSLTGAHIQISYDAYYVTREETPASLADFIKQRTRWNQGFLQTFLKGDWLQLPTLSQRFFSIYLLLWPFVQALFFVYFPFAIASIWLIKVPVGIALITIVPLYVTCLLLSTALIALFEFTRDYDLNFGVRDVLHLVISFYPYNVLLGISAIRALYRTLYQNIAWEKTTHVNAHRELSTELSPRTTF